MKTTILVLITAAMLAAQAPDFSKVEIKTTRLAPNFYVLEGAGGAVLDTQGRPFRYNQRDRILNGDFIALGDTALPWKDWLGG